MNRSRISENHKGEDTLYIFTRSNRTHLGRVGVVPHLADTELLLALCWGLNGDELLARQVP